MFRHVAMDQIDHLGAATECIVPLRCVPFTHECDIKVEIPATPLEPPDRSTSGLSALMNADKNEPDGSFPERTKCTKPRRPRPSAAGKRVSLARRGSPSGLQYGYARILRLSLSFSRLSTFVSHGIHPPSSAQPCQFVVLDLVTDNQLRDLKFLGKFLNVLFRNTVPANPVPYRLRRCQEFRRKGAVPLLMFGSGSCH